MPKSNANFWAKNSKKLHELVVKPEQYLSVQPDLARNVRSLTKELYDLTKRLETKKDSGQALPELIVNTDFDDEQVWQQLELQNSDIYDSLLQKVSHLIAKKKAAKTMKSMEPSDDDDDAEESEDNEEDTSVKKKPKKKKKVKFSGPLKPSVVDDKFFKLQQMEEFLLKEEKEDKDESDSESVDLFADYSDAEGDEREDDAQYKDFFDAPIGEENEATGSAEEGSGKDLNAEESDDFSNGEEGEDQEDEDNVEEESEEEENKPIFEQSPRKKSTLLSDEEVEESRDLPKSSFEERQQRLDKKIERIHDEALGEKPWQLQGEITAKIRPQNSLLEEVLQFDRTQRPAPVITEETTVKLEDIIKQRIKDKVWDDVERKVKPVEDPVEYKKRLTLDQSKSKLSLAEIYEQDFLKQKEKATENNDEEEEEVETPEHTEIKKLMKNLFLKLDAMSNYHYTPKSAAPDVKVITNLPAITVEEVAPVASSDAALLAPEEVKGKLRGNVISKEERTDTDKKRERRKKKAKQRAKQKAHSAKEIAGGGAKAVVKKAIKEGRVKELQVSDRNAVKSSSAFFNRLQEEVSSTISGKKQEMKRKKAQEMRVPAKKLKL